MEIRAEKIGKKFNKEWVIRGLSFDFKRNQSIAIIGPNGSGKSTLLQLISGVFPPSEGELKYLTTTNQIPSDNLFDHISYTAPYLELVEEMTIFELVSFHKKFKPLNEDMSPQEFIEKIKLEHTSNKEIRFLSSGMKQRLKLGLALFSDTPILLLDEPTTNLDNKGIDWYREEILKQIGKRTIIIGSNQRYEYEFCELELTMDKKQI